MNGTDGATMIPCMALVVFLRGIHVGGQGAFRPTVLSEQLASLDAVSVGAGGTLVIRNPGESALFMFRSLTRSRTSEAIFGRFRSTNPECR